LYHRSNIVRLFGVMSANPDEILKTIFLSPSNQAFPPVHQLAISPLHLACSRMPEIFLPAGPRLSFATTSLFQRCPWNPCESLSVCPATVPASFYAVRKMKKLPSFFSDPKRLIARLSFPLPYSSKKRIFRLTLQPQMR